MATILKEQISPVDSDAASKVLGDTTIATSDHENQIPIWFEKTVEYLFAITYLREYQLICPLAGNHERAGDVLFKKGTKWGVIEYKRYEPTDSEKKSQSLRISEIVKFFGSGELQEQVKKQQEMKKFHNIVYGVAQSKRISLAAHNYWNAAEDREIDDILSFGVEDFDFFKKYISLLIKAKGIPPKKGKKGDDDSDDKGKEGGDKQPPDDDAPEGDPPETGPKGLADVADTPEPEVSFMNVIAITPEKEWFCCPFADFVDLIGLGKNDYPPSGSGQTGGNDGMPPLPLQGGGDGSVELDSFELRVKTQEPAAYLVLETPLTVLLQPEPAYV
jgi:hypothetical protein